MEHSYSSEAISGSFWTILERLGANGVTFVVNIVLARLLLPGDYGTIAMISVFVALADVLVQSGLGSALIQKKDVTDDDFSTIFYFNVCFSVILYIVIFLLAPFIALFYRMEILCPVLRVMGISVIVSGINNVQQSIVSRKMIFKLFFYATTSGTIVSGLAGVLAAYYSLGIWAIVIQQLVNRIIDTIILWVLVKWRPQKVFSVKRFKELFKYGWKLLLKSLIDIVFNNLYILIIGRVYSTDTVGYFNKGQSFPNFISTCTNTPMQKVLFPLFSKVQDDPIQLKNGYKRATQIGNFIVIPVMLGLAAVSDNLIILLLTKKWVNSIIYCKLWCISYSLTPILIESQQVINALGYTAEMLKAEIIEKIIGVILIISSFHFGLTYLMMSYIFYVGISTIINMMVVSKYLRYTLINQIKDAIIFYINGMIMSLLVYWISLENILLSLILQIFIGVGIYLIFSFVFSKDILIYCYKSIKRILRKY